MERRLNEGAGKREIPEKTRRPTASSGTIPTCESPVTRPGIEPGSPWWEASVLIAQPPWPRKPKQHEARRPVVFSGYLPTPESWLEVETQRDEDGGGNGRTPRKSPRHGNVRCTHHMKAPPPKVSHLPRPGIEPGTAGVRLTN
ncbi:hypothetical protein PR048_024956 [Dryococelus australis]|uniref:Uncharacterized protein n=1 Tax=Dryococelus australis TaxID=614101 RepID=A0ABQ9GQ10_9NEOP|nr:hypothetical protein PR048_024956 [Dryococelus australis]